MGQRDTTYKVKADNAFDLSEFSNQLDHAHLTAAAQASDVLRLIFGAVIAWRRNTALRLLWAVRISVNRAAPQWTFNLLNGD